MKLFTHVQVEKQFLPANVKELTGWHTHEVVQPSLETLRIKGRRLFYETHVYRYKDANSAFFSGWMRPVFKKTVDLNYHGAMRFYTLNAANEMVEMVARFTNGELFWVKSQSDVDRLRTTGIRNGTLLTSKV